MIIYKIHSFIYLLEKGKTKIMGFGSTFSKGCFGSTFSKGCFGSTFSKGGFLKVDF